MGSVLILFGLTSVGASSANISHSYNASSAIPNGSLVSLDPTRSNYVEVANSENGGQLLGVVVASDDSLLAVDAEDSKTQVATSGSVSALVSTLNGDIKVGDQVAVSPFNGVGARAKPGEHVIGLAQTAFTRTSVGAQSKAIKDRAGKEKQITIGYIRLNIGVGTASTADGQRQLNGLQKLAKSLTGRTVSTTRVVISLIIALVAIIALVTLMYSSIYSGIISIGRNPLAKYAVLRTVTGVLTMAGIMAAVAGLTIFFILR
jgi:hypothetical protein